MIVRYFFFILICIQFYPGTGISAQNLTVSFVEVGPAHTRYLHSPYSDQGFTTVSLQNGNFSTGLHQATYSGVSAYAVSPDNRFIAVLKQGENNSCHVNILNSDGTVHMVHKDVMFLEPNDSSNRLFVHNDGSFTIRANIAGFTLFNPGGEEQARLFNSSGSMMGEAVSELRQSRSGRQIAVYNPRIVRQNRDQSRVQIIEDNQLKEFKTFTDGTLAGLKISDVAGRYITLVDGKSGGTLSVFNPKGELLRQMDVMDNPEHLFVGRDMRHAIVTRQNRVELYDVRSGERIANTVARSGVHFAHFEADHQILFLLAGSSSDGGEIRNPIIYAVDTDARSLKSQELARSVYMDQDQLEIELHQDGDSSWLLLGLNSPVRITL